MRSSIVLAAAELASVEKIAVLETAAAALEVANAALAEENRLLVSENESLSRKVSQMKEAKVPQYDPSELYEGMMPAVYFEIGKTVLSPLELKHLEFIAGSIVAKADDLSEIVITVMGTADGNTGTTKRNKYLSEARGRYVYDMLTEQYGIDKERLVLTSEIIDTSENPEFDRSVVISF